MRINSDLNRHVDLEAPRKAWAEYHAEAKRKELHNKILAVFAKLKSY